MIVAAVVCECGKSVSFSFLFFVSQKKKKKQEIKSQHFNEIVYILYTEIMATKWSVQQFAIHFHVPLSASLLFLFSFFLWCKQHFVCMSRCHSKKNDSFQVILLARASRDYCESYVCVCMEMKEKEKKWIIDGLNATKQKEQKKKEKKWK